MSRRFLCAAAAGLGLALLVGCRGSADRRNRVLFPDMFESLSYKAYDPNPVLARGQTLQLPPEGSVSMEQAAFPYGPGAEEALRAGRELRSPIEPTAAHLKRGRKVYETVCIVCHGPQGQGDGPIIGRFPNPPSLLADRARRLLDGQVFHIISRGQGIMPSHAAQVLPDDRWRAILYLRQLQGAAGGAP
ncbi:MAG TPA: cytochrome c [Vicinamibacteria bacterium]|nr:cytochrome c [Vicinamibacteria bacterium]